MRRNLSPLLLALVTLFTTVLACAEDKVAIRHFPGYALPNQSSEWLDVRVARIAPSTRTETHEIDRFFSSVEATLSKYGIARDWQSVIPDAPYIEITIELNGRRTRLASAHVSLERTGSRIVTERGVESLNQRGRGAVLAQQSEEHRQRRAAFERILLLTLERVRAQLSP